MFCKACGTKVPDGTLFCSACGRPMNMPAGKTAQNSQGGNGTSANQQQIPTVQSQGQNVQSQGQRAQQNPGTPRPVASNPQVTTAQPMANNPQVTAPQPMANNPQVAAPRPAANNPQTGTIPVTPPTVPNARPAVPPVPPVYHPPVPEKKSGAFKVVLAGMLSLLFLAVLGVGVYGFSQGWFGNSPTLQDGDTTTESTESAPSTPSSDPTDPTDDLPQGDFSLVEHQWEGVKLYMREDMYRYHWDVDYIIYYGDYLEVQVDSYVLANLDGEITSSRSFAESYKDVMAEDFRQIGVYNAGDVYYTRGFHDASGLYEVVAFYMSGDYAYSVSVYSSNSDMIDEMVRLSTTATIDTGVIPAIPPYGIDRLVTKQPYYQGLTLNLEESVQDNGFYEGGIGFKNDWMTLRIDSGSMDESWVDFEDPAGQAESCRAGLEGVWEEVSVGTFNGRKYVLAQDSDGYTCVLGCYVKNGVWWEVWLYSYTDRMAVEDMIRAVTSGILE